MKTMTLIASVGLILLSLTASLREVPAAELNVPAQYPTISNAVKAAVSGDTIRIAKGDYYEQFVIVNRRNITLQGEPGAILHATTEMEQTILPYDGLAYTIAGVVRGSEVTFRNLEFQGHRLADYYPAALSAVVFRGSSGRIENCNLNGFRGSFDLDTRAVNVQNESTDGAGISNIGIYNSIFSDNKAAIVLGGAYSNPSLLRTIFNLEGNSIVGAQPSDVVISYGMAIRVGAEGTVKGNRILDHPFSLGIAANDGQFVERGSFFPVKRVIFSENIFSNNAVHLAAIQAHNSVITNNVFETKAQDPRPWGITITGTNLLVAGNNFAEMPLGIDLPAGEPVEGVSRGNVRNVIITNNWFRNVASPIQKNERVTGLVENSTATCCFQPSFLSITNLPVDGSLAFRVRAWHAKPTVLEVSSDLRQWSPVLTNSFPLPISEFEKSVPNSPQQFYRLRAP